jgi:rhodanese-related sulfurtransferase
MSSINSISADRLARLMGTPKCPSLLDVRPDKDFDADPRLVPGSVRRSHDTVAEWATELHGRSAVVICRDGLQLSRGVAALLRDAGMQAEALEGGIEGWVKNDLPLVSIGKLPACNRQGRTLWVTRERPKIDRVACAWLIRRFVDPTALFMFVAPSEVAAVAELFGAAPFDVEGVFWSHRGEACTFDVMIEEFGLGSPALLRLASIVRGADTSRLDLVPEAPGLLAVSLGLSRMYADDLEQLEAGLALYDAFYRWCRDATNETHNWPTNKKGG